MRQLNWNRIDMLEVVEFYADDNGGIASEQALSELFDSEIAPLVIEQYGENDSPAMSEAFNNWSDGLCKEGIIHPEQFANYCYVGKWEA